MVVPRTRSRCYRLRCRLRITIVRSMFLAATCAAHRYFNRRRRDSSDKLDGRIGHLPFSLPLQFHLPYHCRKTRAHVHLGPSRAPRPMSARKAIASESAAPTAVTSSTAMWVVISYLQDHTVAVKEVGRKQHPKPRRRLESAWHNCHFVEIAFSFRCRFDFISFFIFFIFPFFMSSFCHCVSSLQCPFSHFSRFHVFT